MPRYAVGIVNHHSYDDLDRCLDALGRQSLVPEAVYVVDGDSDRDRFREAQVRHPHVIFEARSNTGYAGGANRLLTLIAENWPSVEFVLLLNPDVELEPVFANNLLSAMVTEPRVAIGCGKLLRPGGQVLDSAGIALPPHRRPIDRGSEQRDLGQFDHREYVFGATGAAMMLRCSALPDLAVNGEIFDEDFFVYHEDTDLSWRASLFGWRVLYEPSARGIHSRCWRRKNRFRVPVTVRRHSFKNHYLQLLKNESLGRFVSGLPATLFWEFLRLGFVLLYDRPMLQAYRDAWGLRGRALEKRHFIQNRVRERTARTGGRGWRKPRELGSRPFRILRLRTRASERVQAAGES